MAGHNKWSKIKRQKAVTDAKKSSIYTKMAKSIMVAVKTGGGADPATNFRLKSAIDKAKEFGVPKNNIERAIEKGAGKGEGDNLKEITYEGYLPGGVAVMVFTATDNSNRTLSDVRTIFTKAGGSLGSTGSVAYLFHKEGDELVAMHTIEIDSEEDAQVIMKALDALDDNDDVIDVVSNFDLSDELSIKLQDSQT